jgi:tRNA threonylcarbamoyladenosine biosynthesis protein TsaE
MDAIFTLESIDKVAAMFWHKFKHQKLWAFHAAMGSGKTTFIHALCKSVLQINENISSPTFSIINEYKSNVIGTVYHTDWYRLKNEQEAIDAGVEDMLDSGCLCLIEWPENAIHLLPANTLHIYIEVLDDFTRRVYVPTAND